MPRIYSALMRLPATAAIAAICGCALIGAACSERPPAPGNSTTTRDASPAIVRVAVASNFATTARELADVFQAESGVAIEISTGSTGMLCAQIVHGAPFDVFLAADAKRPQALESTRNAVRGTRFTYARGRLVLWRPGSGVVDATGDILARGEFKHLALANPELAPYGVAARQVLESRGLWRPLADKLVFGQNIAQTFQLVQTRNAELGFVALSQVLALDPMARGSYWQVPQTLHDPIEQQAVLLTDAARARAFLDFLRSDRANQLIRDAGYDVP